MNQINCEKVNLFWFRRDLRTNDNKGLEAAFSSGGRVLPLFISDPEILDRLENKQDRRVEFIFRNLHRIETKLGPVLHFYAKPADAFRWLVEHGKEELGIEIQSLYCNEDYEPYAIQRDNQVELFLLNRGIKTHLFTDQVIFSPHNQKILKLDGTPYTIYTPYSKRWRAAYGAAGLSNADTSTAGLGDTSDSKPSSVLGITKAHIAATASTSIPKLVWDSPTLRLFRSTPSISQIGFQNIENLGFTDNPKQILGEIDNIISDYHKTRDIPALENGTSKLGIHLRFGTVSIREVVEKATILNDTWLGELIWREFFMQIIKHFPYSEDAPFTEKYKFVPWRNDQADIEAWMRGETGYPLVDAGMRELNETGHMHNRVRMVVASFLTKHLLVDWRIGETYFASKLNDYELASNVGNWQWAAGTGCDAAPYFRIFNPTEQARKFDPQSIYIRKWVPELVPKWFPENQNSYPSPIVDHKFARERALAAYALAVKSN